MSETAKKPAAKKTTTKPAAKRTSSGPKIIRNLRNCAVHLRFTAPESDKPYRIAMQPRGLAGDAWEIPYKLTQTYEFKKDLGVLFEIITKTEFNALDYTSTSFQRQLEVEMVREDDSVIASAPQWGGKGIAPHERNLTTREDLAKGVKLPSAADLGAENPAMPPEVAAMIEAQYASNRPQQPAGVKLERGHRVD